MPEYIEREAVAELVDRMKYYAHEYCTGGNLGREIEGTDKVLFGAVDAIERLTADVVPVVHGRWREADDGDGVVCSVCGEDFCNIYLEVDRFKYCPNCGARMDGE